MEAHEKDQIRVGSMFSSGNKSIYRVTKPIFTDLITYKFGEPVENNTVDVVVYQEQQDGTFQEVRNIDLLHIRYIYPLSVKRRYLELIRFKSELLGAKQVLKYGQFYFEDFNDKKGVHLLKKIGFDGIIPVASMHMVQIAVAEL